MSVGVSKSSDSISSINNKLDALITSLDKVDGKKASVHVNTEQVDKAVEKVKNLDEIIAKGRRQKRDNYYVSETESIKQLTQAWNEYSQAKLNADKEKAQHKVMRWANAHRANGYSTDKIDHQVFKLADDTYNLYNGTKGGNSLSTYSIESFKELFGALKEKGVDTKEAEQRLANQTKTSIVNGINKGVKDAKEQKVDVSVDEILDVNDGKLRGKIDKVKKGVEQFYNTLYDENGNQKRDSISNTKIERFIRDFTQYEQYLDKIGQKVEQKYKKLFDTVGGFSKDKKQSDFAEYIKQEQSISEDVANKDFQASKNKAERQAVKAAKQQLGAQQPDSVQNKQEEIEYIDQLINGFNQEKKKLDELRKKVDETKAAYDAVYDANDLIDVRAIIFGGKNSKGEQFKENPFGYEGNLPALENLVNTKIREGKMNKAASYYGLYKDAGGDKHFSDLTGAIDLTDELEQRYLKLVSAVSKGSNALKEDLMNAANEAREQQEKTDIAGDIVKSQLNEQELSAVDAYIKKVKALKKEAFNETDALSQALSIVRKIEKRDVSGLMDMFTKDKPENNALLSKMTGKTLRSQKDRDSALRSLNQEQYDQIISKQTKAVVDGGAKGVSDAVSDIDNISGSTEKLKEQIQVLLEFDKTLDHVMGEERNQTSGKSFFDYLVQNGTEAQKTLFNVQDGVEAFQVLIHQT